MEKNYYIVKNDYLWIAFLNWLKLVIGQTEKIYESFPPIKSNKKFKICDSDTFEIIFVYSEVNLQTSMFDFNP